MKDSTWALKSWNYGLKMVGNDNMIEFTTIYAFTKMKKKEEKNKFLSWLTIVFNMRNGSHIFVYLFRIWYDFTSPSIKYVSFHVPN